MNHYEVLGVLPQASTADIRRAFRRLSRRLHPDMPGGHPQAFQLVSEAHRVLTDADLRARYDARLPRRAAKSEPRSQTHGKAVQKCQGATTPARTRRSLRQPRGSAPRTPAGKQRGRWLRERDLAPKTGSVEVLL